jgi:hypothetical protein
MESRSIAKPVPRSSGTPWALALLQESCPRLPVGTDRGTLDTTTFHTAVDDDIASISQRRCAAPSMVLPGPSGSALGLRYWRVSKMKTSRSEPQRKLR